MNFAIRRILPTEGERLAQIRLAALLESPSAFGSTYAREVAFTPDDWAERARVSATGNERVTFFAFNEAAVGPRANVRPVGLVGAYRLDDEPEAIDLVSMWTAPEARRHGVGLGLVTAVIAWAKLLHVRTITLCVMPGNEAALALYARLGFVPTTEGQPLALDLCQGEVRMHLFLPR
jgi:RimJ/RimL family protein N-acetyltransferase